MYEALVIQTDGSAEIVQCNNYKDLQTHVGGNFEVVAATLGGDTLDFWINDEGKLIGLDVNLPATLLWYALVPEMIGQDVLCGPVVITGGPDANGDTQGIPAALKDKLVGAIAGASL